MPRAFAQQAQLYRIGWLSYGRTMGGARAIEAFRGGLRDMGYAEGRNLQILERLEEDGGENMDRLAAELVAWNPHAIVTLSIAVRAVLNAGARMPIVFAFSGDPVEAKLVQSYDHPGGNLTGISMLALELVGKRLELVKELKPGMQRVAIIANPQHPGRQAELAASQAAARSLGLSLDYFEMRTAVELEKIFARITAARSEAIVVFPDSRTNFFSERIARFAAQERIPAISGWAHFAEQGNVIAYGPDFDAAFRRLAYYVDRLLKGAKPGDLPVEFPTRFELCVNLKAARAMGLKVPQSIMLRADRVIE